MTATTPPDFAPHELTDLTGLALPSVVAAGPAALADRPQTDLVRVLHVVNGEHYSGAERVQDLLGLRLPAVGFEPGFACLRPDLFPRMRRSKDRPLYEVPMRTRLDLRAGWKLARIVRRGGYRLVHAHTPRAAMVGRLGAWLARVPLVYHVHSPTSRDSTRRLHNWASALTERLSLRGVARLIVVSESLGRHMEQSGFDPRKISVVPNGVPRVDPLLEHTPPLGRWTLGTVALFRPRKGTEVLLEALALLDRQGLPVRLRAVGPFQTPRYEAELKDRAKRLGLAELVEWTGFAADVNTELEKLDLFVLPSLFGEGMPMVVLEAMAAGVPVVATEVEGVPEVIRDGREGLIARPGDPQELAQAIARIIRGEVDWAALRRSALARHAERFSDRAMAAGVAAAYREVLEEVGGC